MARPHTATPLSHSNCAIRHPIISETYFDSNNTICNATQPLADHDRPLSTSTDVAAEKACAREDLRSPQMTDLENQNNSTPRYNSFCGKGDDTVTVLSNDLPSGPGLRRRLSGCVCGDDRKPKAITRTSFWKHSKVEVAVHIAALTLTAFAFWLGWKERYWFALEGPSPDRGVNADVIINLLQLPAKLHEILIVASLSFIMLAMCRRRLVGEGVKLGFLTGAYQVGDLEYILAPSSPLWHMGFKHLSLMEVTLACYLVLSTLMSTVLGPVSAFMLIPTLERFPLEHASAFSEIKMPIVYDYSPEEIWPRILNDTAVFSKLCSKSEGVVQSWCPAGGFSEIWNWAYSVRSTYLQYNLTFQLPSADLRRDLVHVAAGRRKTSLSTTPSHFLLSTLGLFQQLIEDNNVGALSHNSRYNLKARLVDYNDTENDAKYNPIFQPFVQSKCQVHNIASVLGTKEKLTYPTDALNCFGHSECQAYKLNPPELEDVWWTRSIQHNSTFTTGYSIDGNRNSVIKVAGKLSNSQSAANDLVFTCGLLASWIPSNFSMMSSKEGNTFYSAFNSRERMNETFHQNSLGGGHVITMNATWLRYTDPNITASMSDDGNNNSTALYKILHLFSGSSEDVDNSPGMLLTELGTTGAEYLLSTVFGVYLTEALARTGAGGMTSVDVEADADEMSGIDLTKQYNPQGGVFKVQPLNATHTKWDYGTRQSVRDIALDVVYSEMLPSRLSLDFEVERFGFGTGHPRKTLTFARAIMYIYVGVVCFYALTIGYAQLLELTGRQQRFWIQGIEPWSCLHELFVLALRSPPPSDKEFADVGAGVSSSQLWEKRLRARGDRSHHVCLVLDDGAQTERLDMTGKVKYY